MAEQIILNKHKKFYVRGEWLFIKKKSIIDFIDELYAIIARKEKLPVDGGDAVCRQIEDYNNKVAA